MFENHLPMTRHSGLRIFAFQGGNLRQPPTSTLLLLLPICSVLGCAASGKTAGHEPASGASHEYTLPSTIVSSSEAISADALFERGNSRFEQRQFSSAAADLEAAASALPEQTRALLAWYRAGIARDESGDLVNAMQDFARVVEDRTAIGRDAQLRLIRLLVFTEQWEKAGDYAGKMAGQYSNLRPIETIVTKGALALSHVSRNQLDETAREVEAARTVIEQNQFDVASQIQRDVAVVYFALGELRRARANTIRFVPLPAHFGEHLERRCQMLLDAQSAYSTAMRAYDSHWSIMAGYRVSQLYEDLHADLMQMIKEIKVDDPEQQKLFEAALRLRYAILLEKAGKSLEHTVALAERTEENSKWVEWARDAQKTLTQSLADEKAAVEQVPYTREQLMAALDNLSKLRARTIDVGARNQQGKSVTK